MISKSPLSAVAVLTLLALATGTSPAPAGEKKSAPRVVIIGIDGISLNLLQPFEKAGVIPNLQALAKEGIQARLKSFWPLRTMQVWTSIVTGKLPGQHGIWDHVTNSYYNPPGYRTKQRKVYTPADRKSKALWQLLAAHQKKTLVVGWPTTWPAEKAKGAVIVAPKVLYGDDRRVTIKGSLWKHVTGAVQPAALLPRVRERIVEPKDVSDRELGILADPPPGDSPLYRLPKIESYVYALRWSIARARSIEAVTIDLLEKTRPDVVLTYFQCTDSLLHRFWIFQKPKDQIRARLDQFGIATGQVPEMKRRFGKVVENCYRDVDRRVGRILEKARGPDTLVLIVSDHGFGDGPEKHPFKAEPYGGIHWSDGAILAAGPDLPAGAKIEKASVLDITPTVLYLLGLPVAGDMRGQVIRDLFSSSRMEKHPVETIPTYEKEPQLEVPYAEGFPPKPEQFVW